jgi:hypothetical protein
VVLLQQNPTKIKVIWVVTILSKLCFHHNSSANTLLSWTMTHGNNMLNPTANFMNFQSAAEMMVMFAFASLVVNWAIVNVKGEHKVFP